MNVNDLTSINDYIQYIEGKYIMLQDYYHSITLYKIGFNYVEINDYHYTKMSKINYYNDSEHNELLKELKVHLTHLPNKINFYHWSENLDV